MPIVSLRPPSLRSDRAASHAERLRRRLGGHAADRPRLPGADLSGDPQLERSGGERDAERVRQIRAPAVGRDVPRGPARIAPPDQPPRVVGPQRGGVAERGRAVLDVVVQGRSTYATLPVASATDAIHWS